MPARDAPSADPVTVVCLCAAWCGVCRDWRPAFEQLARRRTDLRFAWVDVEDEDEAMGEVEVENFPSVLIARGAQALFLGPVAPSMHGLERLVEALSAQPQPQAGDAREHDALLGRLARGAIARGAL
jgi:thioredoxin 1